MVALLHFDQSGTRQIRMLLATAGRDPDVEQLIADWLEAKQTADAERISSALSDSDAVLAIGTAADEWCAGSDAFLKAHTSAPPFQATIEHIEAYSDGPVAWAAARASIDVGKTTPLQIRLTLVLVSEQGGWRIVQSHASVAGSN